LLRQNCSHIITLELRRFPLERPIPTESLSVESVFGLTGLIILVGLAGELVFTRTGIPSV